MGYLGRLTLGLRAGRRASWLFITPTCVELQADNGRISDGQVNAANPANKSIEVIININPATNARHFRLMVRTFVLAPDGSKLLEMRGERMVGARIRCVPLRK